MDAIKFIEEARRRYKVTGEVPSVMWNWVKPESIVKEVEEWSVKHPLKTRQSVFLAEWPSAKIDKDIGVLNICPADLDERYRDARGRCNICSTQTGTCDLCRQEFWNEEVK